MTIVAQGDQSDVVRDSLAMHMALAVMADSVGAAQAIFDKTVEYMKTRVQFDKVIAGFQGLKHMAADMKVEWELARHAAARAMAAAEAGDADRMAWVLLGKAQVTDAFAGIAGKCVQMHGGVGHTWAFDPHIYLKRAHLNQMLVAHNNQHLDQAADGLAAAVRAGRSVLDLPLGVAL